ncbi:hypothetical protein E2986_01939 [Frieseomelitta varia]|uniref:protein-tyrosine-phosphatase n=1 Tax=Frieseomelitta varia TaxID=561572 RepID=A0A833SDA9_9HYME|nr:hypothetical protein E2986_01939 [Frieseomelitta varia]
MTKFLKIRSMKFNVYDGLQFEKSFVSNYDFQNTFLYRDVVIEVSLFKNAFNIENISNDTVKSKPKIRRQILSMAARRYSSPESVSPSIDKENNSAVCGLHYTSPLKIVNARRLRQPLEDCDPNSQDSGYEACYIDKDEKSKCKIRFAEPLVIDSPCEQSIGSRTPATSPIRLSPVRLSPDIEEVIRSISSGYESMDDGFNDLDENLDEAAQIPNGISTLIRGNFVDEIIVSNSSISDQTTAEFSRTTNNEASGFRRSLILQYTAQKNQKNLSLPKVRSCLFHSSNANSSTSNPGFDGVSPLSPRICQIRRRQTAASFANRNVAANTFNSPISRALKRQDSPMIETPKLVKRLRRCTSFLDIVKSYETFEPKSLQKSFSASEMTMGTLSTKMETDTVTEVEMKMETESETGMEVSSESEIHAYIKSAIHRSTTDADLTGDFSKPCILPLAAGHHEDLKSISVDTLASLIRGEFNDKINSFKIVDCRYPYEFDAGHIQNALNLYSKDLIEQILLNPLTNTPEIQPDTNKRNILVFHCEFSWERGPNLSRFLRSLDRERNKERYPALYYPEVYLLHGGYEQFYKKQKELCSPQGYRPMSHPDHQADLKIFRSKSKSWQNEKSKLNACATRINLDRVAINSLEIEKLLIKKSYKSANVR